MSVVDAKLNQLKECLGEKKLKQLGLLECATCNRILEQAATFSVPVDMDEKTFLTSEEMNKINAVLTQSASQTLNRSNFHSSNDSEITPIQEMTIPVEPQDLKDETAFLKKLAAIIKSSQPAADEDLGIGYIYNCPSTPLPHSLICSECGRLYAIGHPSLELLPLPVYLTDTEYEMIKGIYVDIVL